LFSLYADDSCEYIECWLLDIDLLYLFDFADGDLNENCEKCYFLSDGCIEFQIIIK